MKVLFVASLNKPSASGRQRLWAMQACNVSVIAINKDIFAKFKYWASLIHKLKIGFLLRNKVLERAIYRTALQNKPDIIWIEWAREVSPVLLKKLKEINKDVRLLSFTDDNPWGKRKGDVWMWHFYFKNIPFFDIHLVKRNSDIVNIQNYGSANCYKWTHGIYIPLFIPANPPKPALYPVSFVGTCMDGRDNLIGYLLDNGIDIHVFGNMWNQRSHLPSKYPQNFHPPVEGVAYVDVIQKSNICLGLVSNSNEDEWTMRSFEVIGCKKLLLAENTNTHRLLFSKYCDQVLFENYKDCFEKIKVLQNDRSLVEIISTDVYNNFMQNNSTLDQSMNNFLNIIK